MCFPITKIKIATLPTAKFIVTLMAENSLDIPNVQKALKKKKKKREKGTQNKSKTQDDFGRDITCHFFLFSSSAADGFQENQIQFDFRKLIIPILAP